MARISLMLAIALASCVDDPGGIATTFARETFCPDARVHVAPVPDLALVASEASRPHVEPWHEPVAPPEIARDPERMKLWTAKRDADHDAWARQRELAGRRAIQTTPIFEVTGCGGARLYVCHSGRHAFQCVPIDSELSAMTSIACKHGGAIRATRDGAIACTPGEPPIDRAACVAACPNDGDCTSRCGGDSACALACAADAARCRLGCESSAREQCDASGLGIFGACTLMARDEQSARDAATRLGDAAATYAQAAARQKRLAAATAEQQRCSDSCRGTGEPRAMMTCLLECTTTARERCEGDEPHLDWCEAFRSEERALQQRLGQ